jgi:dTDP-4-dehydrorhamnose 3,5-epimerase
MSFVWRSTSSTLKWDVRPLSIPGAQLIRSAVLSDPRGYFVETYQRSKFAGAGIFHDFVQDNQSGSIIAGTVRGLHFQIPPFAQTKLIRVLRGRILDVVVDLRRSSSTFGKHTTVELADDTGDQLLVPAEFAHGFCTLVANTEVLYKVDNIYSPQHERGLNWADPELGIDWPVAPANAVLSDRDQALPFLRDLSDSFPPELPH